VTMRSPVKRGFLSSAMLGPKELAFLKAFTSLDLSPLLMDELRKELNGSKRNRTAVAAASARGAGDETGSPSQTSACKRKACHDKATEPASRRPATEHPTTDPRSRTPWANKLPSAAGNSARPRASWPMLQW
jgi:hypothetical protein